MDGEQIYIIILRILHIAGAMIWFGGTVFMIYVLEPATELAKEDGARFMNLLARQKSFQVLFPAASGTTFLAGFLLFERVARRYNMASGYGNALGIGALAGIVAFIIGAAWQSRIQKKRLEIGTAILQNGNRPTPEQLQQLGELGESADKANRLSMLALVIAVIGMSAAQYL